MSKDVIAERARRYTHAVSEFTQVKQDLAKQFADHPQATSLEGTYTIDHRTDSANRSSIKTIVRIDRHNTGKDIYENTFTLTVSLPMEDNRTEILHMQKFGPGNISMHDILAVTEREDFGVTKSVIHLIGLQAIPQLQPVDIPKHQPSE